MGATAAVAAIRARLETVRAQIEQAAQRAGRDPAGITVVVVTKSFPAEVVRATVAAGLAEIGENRVQEAQAKRAALSDLRGVRWHLVGHLQRNKAGQAVDLFDLIHSLDSLRLAQTLEQRAAARGKVVPVLLEVNVAGEASKFGFSLEDEAAFFSAVEKVLTLSHLRAKGLMTVAPICSDPEEVRPVFRRLWELSQALQQRYPEGEWGVLSMGMSEDYQVAVEEGATMVRLGRALLGPRPGG